MGDVDLNALWAKHVKSSVKTRSNTKKIIEKILPHLEGTDIMIVSGYLNDIDQFWKVNHHYDYLRWMLVHCIDEPKNSKQTKGYLKAVLGSLDKSKPNPVTGYRTGGLGQPQDSSSYDEIRRRWRLLRQAKKDWAALCKKTEIMQNRKRAPKAFKHPQSPIRPPGTSMHGTGYAIDMTGDYGKIKAICRKLAATLIYEEPGNMHLEFAKM